MIITWLGGQNFSVKTKNLTVKLGDKIALGELTIENPGEYEVAGVQLEVIDGVVQLYAESMNIGHIKKGKLMSDDELSKMSGIDVLLIGVGGDEFTETKTALEVVGQIDPSVVIPMYEKSLEGFVKEEGAKAAQDEFKITRPELPQDEREMVVLNPRS